MGEVAPMFLPSVAVLRRVDAPGGTADPRLPGASATAFVHRLRRSALSSARRAVLPFPGVSPRAFPCPRRGGDAASRCGLGLGTQASLPAPLSRSGRDRRCRDRSLDRVDRRPYQGVRRALHSKDEAGRYRRSRHGARSLPVPGARRYGCDLTSDARYGDRLASADAPMLRPWAPDECTDRRCDLFARGSGRSEASTSARCPSCGHPCGHHA
jgi:hypothetical protein